MLKTNQKSKSLKLKIQSYNLFLSKMKSMLLFKNTDLHQEPSQDQVVQKIMSEFMLKLLIWKLLKRLFKKLDKCSKIILKLIENDKKKKLIL